MIVYTCIYIYIYIFGNWITVAAAARSPVGDKSGRGRVTAAEALLDEQRFPEKFFSLKLKL